MTLILVGVLLGIGLLMALIGPRFESSLSPFCVQVVNSMKTLYTGAGVSFLLWMSTRAVARQLRPNKRLSYEIVSLAPVYTADGSYRGKVSVEYLGRAVENLHICQVVLRNTGNRTLENQGVLISLIGASILKKEIRHEPELEFGAITWDDKLGKDRVKYYFSQLEPGDKVTIDLIFDGSIGREDVKVDARGEMLRVVPEWAGWKIVTVENVPWLLVGPTLLLAVLLLAIAPGPGLVGRLRELGYLISDWLENVSAESGFSAGFWLGVATLAVGMFLILRLRIWWGGVTAPLKTDEVWSTTGETAARDLRKSVVALVTGTLVIACIVGMLVTIFFPDILKAVGL